MQLQVAPGTWPQAPVGMFAQFQRLGQPSALPCLRLEEQGINSQNMQAPFSPLPTPFRWLLLSPHPEEEQSSS